MISNPILPGFNPDPSICRKGDDYYIATSTFEWYPGVQIHHSTDLTHWNLVARPLNRPAQLDMRGNPDSGGVWAPCISYADGKFWLVYTDVKRIDGNFKDSHNYIVNCETIDGDWSDPIYANSSGFDPSLFHDEDGRKWFVNMVWNHRSDSIGGSPKHPAFAGILLQEFDYEARALVGPIKNIFKGSSHGLVEAPHLFKRNGWYFLTVAEGGTGYDHAVTMARSKALTGPYELHPNTHLITAKDCASNYLQRCGHGQWIETPGGESYHTFLCSRPLPGTKRSPLGRETGIEKCKWHADDWLYLETDSDANEQRVPRQYVPSPGMPFITDELIENAKTQTVEYDFVGTELPMEFQWLRTPHPERMFNLDGPHLTLIARESTGSWFEQSLLARRQEHWKARIESTLEFNPVHFQQVAGIIHYYNRHKFLFFGITHHESLGRVLTLLSCPGHWPDGQLEFPLPNPIPLTDTTQISLAIDIDHHKTQCQYHDGNTWQNAGPVLDASVISDEGGRGEHASFTGAFLGMHAFDTSGSALAAHYHKFSYTGFSES